MINASMHPPSLVFSLPVRHSLMVVADEGTVLDRATLLAGLAELRGKA